MVEVLEKEETGVSLDTANSKTGWVKLKLTRKALYKLNKSVVHNERVCVHRDEDMPDSLEKEEADVKLV